MRTNFLQQNKRAKKSVFQRVAFAALFLGVIGLLNVLHINPLEGVAHSVSTTIWSTKEGTQKQLNDFYQLLRSKKALVEDNHDLRRSLNEVAHLELSNEALRLENEELKAMLGRGIEESMIMGSVVSRPNTSPYDTAIIDIGSKDGVHVGDEVVALGDFVIGYISSVKRSTAQVTFYSSPGIKTNVFIGEDSIPATAEGRGANNFVVQLPRDAEVSEGAIVTLSNLDTQVFGAVENIVRNSTDAFQILYFKNPVNVFNIKWIQVIRSEQ